MDEKAQKYENFKEKYEKWKEVNLSPKSDDVSSVSTQGDTQPEDVSEKDEPESQEKKDDSRHESSSIEDPREKRKRQVFAQLLSFLVFIPFLIFVNIVTFGVMDDSYNYYAHVLSDIFTNTKFNTSLGVERTFKEIVATPQIWEYIKLVFFKIIYENDYDKSRTLDFVKAESFLVLFSNILVGVPRIRQVRVKNDSCEINPFFENNFNSCYGHYSVKNEDQEKSDNFNSPYFVGNGPFFGGKISSYGPGGFIFEISRDQELTQKFVNDELEYHNWINIATRAIFIDFTTYTPNTNLFCVAKLVLELPPTGGVITSSYFYTMKFIRYVNTWDFFIFGCEIVVMLFILCYTFGMLLRLIKLKFFTKFWNYVDLSILIAAYMAIALGVVRFIKVENSMEEKVDSIDKNVHASFEDLVQIQIWFNTMMAILCFLVWLKLLKFASLFPSGAIVLNTFSKISWEIFSLFCMLFVLIIGFALFGYILFGTTNEQFDSVINSIFSLLGIFVGGTYFFKDCQEVRPYMAPLYFTLFIFIVVLLFLNCFIALIVHGFYLAYEDYEEQARSQVYIKDILNDFCYKFLKCINCKEQAEKCRTAGIKKENKKNYDDLINVLRRHGFRGLELELLIKKYDLSPEKEISMKTMDLVYEEIIILNQLYIEVLEHDKIITEAQRIKEKVQFLETALADVNRKVDNLIEKEEQEE